MSVANLVHHDDLGIDQCQPDQTVLKAAEQMVANDINALAVVQKDGRLSGIITDHDVMRALVATRGQLELEQVAGWMTSNVITCDADKKLSAALDQMGRHRIRHLVVVQNDRPLAVVGIRDVLDKMHKNDELEMNVLRDLAMVRTG